MITKITNNDLTEALCKDVAVLDFSAKWCGPCKMLAPVMEAVADTMQDHASFYAIDVDENPALAMEYRVSSIPCIVILKGGKESSPGHRLPAPAGLAGLCGAASVKTAHNFNRQRYALYHCRFSFFPAPGNGAEQRIILQWAQNPQRRACTGGR